jgi:prevent-host-death family protein
MEQVNIHQAKTHFSKLVEKVLDGQEIIISKAGKPVAKLVPFNQGASSRKLGLMKGKIRMSADFDAPLPESIIEEFEG